MVRGAYPSPKTYTKVCEGAHHMASLHTRTAKISVPSMDKDVGPQRF